MSNVIVAGTKWLLLILLLLQTIGLISPALALTENLLEVPGVRVHNTGAYLSPVLNASTYNTLSLSFTFDATTLDFGPPQDSLTYGYVVDGNESVLGNVVGLAGADPLEISSINLSLPAEARVNGLQIFMRVTANSAQSSDKVEVTNLQLTGSKPDPIDVCPNLPELQTVIPEGYHLEGENCIEDTPPPVDICLNLDGVQESLPSGYQLTTTPGVCELIPPPPVDICPNLPEVQVTIPVGYHLEGANCVPDVVVPVDLCPNLEGEQIIVPVGYHLEGLNCIPDSTTPVDVCPNIPEIQLTIPVGYLLVSGACEPISTTTDVCLNLPGEQVTVPEGYTTDEAKNCTLITPPPIDVCLNLEEVQATLPTGYQVDAIGVCTLIIIPIDLCPNMFGIQEVIPPGLVLNNKAECVPKPFIDDHKPGKGGGGKGTRIHKFYLKQAGECPAGFAKWIDRFRESHVWVADDVYQEVLLVGGPKPGQKNLDGAHFLKISGPTEVGDKYFRRFHEIKFVCVKG